MSSVDTSCKNILSPVSGTGEYYCDVDEAIWPNAGVGYVAKCWTEIIGFLFVKKVCKLYSIDKLRVGVLKRWLHY